VEKPTPGDKDSSIKGLKLLLSSANFIIDKPYTASKNGYWNLTSSVNGISITKMASYTGLHITHGMSMSPPPTTPYATAPSAVPPLL
jgi:hypothetical protein